MSLSDRELEQIGTALGNTARPMVRDGQVRAVVNLDDVLRLLNTYADGTLRLSVHCESSGPHHSSVVVEGRRTT